MLTKVKKARLELGINQCDLADKLDISISALNRIEKGNFGSTKLSTLKKIAAALNSTVEELFLKEDFISDNKK